MRDTTNYQKKHTNLCPRCAQPRQTQPVHWNDQCLICGLVTPGGPGRVDPGSGSP
jgi:hypothetical protein